MNKKNLIRFARSLVLVPMITASFGIGNMGSSKVSGDVLAKANIVNSEATVLNQAIAPEESAQEARARAIDEYFLARNMPLAGTGAVMVEEAEKNGLDWRLVAAIAVRESTGGRHACKKAAYNPFGWGSCKISFKSNAHAIETVARNLAGNNPNTAQHYKDKDTRGILQAYNPPHIVPRYADQVISIMNAIGPADLGIATKPIEVASS